MTASDNLKSEIHAQCHGPADSGTGKKSISLPSGTELASLLALVDGKINEYQPLFDSLAPAQIKAIGDLVATVIHGTNQIVNPPTA